MDGTKGPEYVTEKERLIKQALLINWILIGYNIAEAVASIVFGYKAESVSLIGFGFDSIIEVAAASILVWRLSVDLPKEQEEKVEKKALFFIGVTFLLLAAYVGYESVTKLLSRQAPEQTLPGVIIATLSLLIMPFLGLKKLAIARKIGSKALEADAMETLICSYLSAILLAGLGLHLLFGWWWADPVAGLAMLYFIITEGLEALKGDRDCSSCK